MALNARIKEEIPNSVLDLLRATRQTAPVNPANGGGDISSPSNRTWNNFGGGVEDPAQRITPSGVRARLGQSVLSAVTPERWKAPGRELADTYNIGNKPQQWENLRADQRRFYETYDPQHRMFNFESSTGYSPVINNMKPYQDAQGRYYVSKDNPDSPYMDRFDPRNPEAVKYWQQKNDDQLLQNILNGKYSNRDSSDLELNMAGSALARGFRASPEYRSAALNATASGVGNLSPEEQNQAMNRWTERKLNDWVEGLTGKRDMSDEERNKALADMQKNYMEYLTNTDPDTRAGRARNALMEMNDRTGKPGGWMQSIPGGENILGRLNYDTGEVRPGVENALQAFNPFGDIHMDWSDDRVLQALGDVRYRGPIYADIQKYGGRDGMGNLNVNGLGDPWQLLMKYWDIATEKREYQAHDKDYNSYTTEYEAHDTSEGLSLGERHELVQYLRNLYQTKAGEQTAAIATDINARNVNGGSEATMGQIGDMLMAGRSLEAAQAFDVYYSGLEADQKDLQNTLKWDPNNNKVKRALEYLDKEMKLVEEEKDILFSDDFSEKSRYNPDAANYVDSEIANLYRRVNGDYQHNDSTRNVLNDDEWDRYMTQTQKLIFNYKFSEDPKKAKEYFDAIKNNIDYNKTEAYNASASEKAEQHPVMGVLFKTTSMPFRAVSGGIGSTIGANPNSTWFAFSNVSTAVHETVSNKLDEATKDWDPFWKDAAKMGFDAGVQSIESMIGMSFGSLAAGMFGLEAGSTAAHALGMIQSVDAYQATYAKYYKEGHENDANFLAAMSGLMEFTTEMVGMEWALGGAKASKHVILCAALRGGVAEALEELPGSVAMIYLENELLGSESEINVNIDQRTHEIMKSGEINPKTGKAYTREEAELLATSQVYSEAAYNILYEMEVAGLSGGLHVGAQAAVDVSGVKYQSRINQKVKDNIITREQANTLIAAERNAAAAAHGNNEAILDENLQREAREIEAEMNRNEWNREVGKIPEVQKAQENIADVASRTFAQLDAMQDPTAGMEAVDTDTRRAETEAKRQEAQAKRAEAEALRQQMAERENHATAEAAETVDNTVKNNAQAKAEAAQAAQNEEAAKHFNNAMRLSRQIEDAQAEMRQLEEQLDDAMHKYQHNDGVGRENRVVMGYNGENASTIQNKLGQLQHSVEILQAQMQEENRKGEEANARQPVQPQEPQTQRMPEAGDRGEAPAAQPTQRGVQGLGSFLGNFANRQEAVDSLQQRIDTNDDEIRTLQRELAEKKRKLNQAKKSGNEAMISMLESSVELAETRLKSAGDNSRSLREMMGRVKMASNEEFGPQQAPAAEEKVDSAESKAEVEEQVADELKEEAAGETDQERLDRINREIEELEQQIAQAENLPENEAKPSKRQKPNITQDEYKTYLEAKAGIRILAPEEFNDLKQRAGELEYYFERTPFGAAVQVANQDAILDGFEKSGADATVRIKTKNEDGTYTQQAVPLKDVDFGDKVGLEYAYERAAAYNDTVTARNFLAGFEQSKADLFNYTDAFEGIYAQALSGTQMTEKQQVAARLIEPNIREMIEKAAQRARGQMEEELGITGETEADITEMENQIAEAGSEQANAKDYTGVVRDFKMKMNGRQRANMNSLHWISRNAGMKITLTDNIKNYVNRKNSIDENAGLNGFFRTGTNEAIIDVHSLDDAVVLTAFHEAWHFCKQEALHSADLAQKVKGIETILENHLKNLPGYDMEQRIQDVIDLYKQAGQKLDRNGALEEIYADALRGIADRGLVTQFQQATGADTVLDKIRSVLNKWKNYLNRAVRKLGESSPEVRAILNAKEEDLAKLSRALRITQHEAGQTYAARTHEAEQGEDRYSLIGKDPETGRSVYLSSFEEGTPKPIKSQHILNLIQNIWQHNPIKLTVTENGQEREVIARFDPRFDENDTRTSNAGKLANGPRHGNKNEQRVSLNLADDYHEILQESSYDRTDTEKKPDKHPDVKLWHYFVDDIYYVQKGSDIAEPYQVVVDIKETSDDSFVYSYTAHEDGTVEKKKVSAMGLRARQQPLTEAESAHLSEVNILQNGRKVKTEFNPETDRASISPQTDRDYLDAVKNGDTETASQMVEKAAKRAGYTLKVTHRTNAEFNVFDKTKRSGKNGKSLGDGFYVAELKDGRRSEYDSDAYGKNRIVAYVDPGNVFNLAKGLSEEQAEYVYDKYFKPFHEDRFGTYKPHVIEKLQSSTRLMDYIIEAAETNDTTTDEIFKDLGYDSIKDGPQYAIFDSNQIKRADTATYDDDGELIPLSERFNKEEEDIRYSLSPTPAVETAADRIRYSFASEVEDGTANAEMQRLAKENAQMRELVQAITAQMNEWRGENVVDDKQVARMARMIRRELETTIPFDDLKHDLTKVFDAMAKAKNPTESKAAIQALSDLVLYAVQTSQHADKAKYEEYKEARDIIKSIKFSRADYNMINDAVGDKDSFRRKYFGRIAGSTTRLAESSFRNAYSVEDAWRDLHDRYGNMFPEDIQNPADQLAHMLAFLDETEIQYYNPYTEENPENLGASMADYVASDYTMRVLKEFMTGGREVKNSRAQTRMANIERLLTNTQTAMAEERKTEGTSEFAKRYNEQIKALRAELKQSQFETRKAERQLERVKEKAREAVVEERERQTDIRRRQAERRAEMEDRSKTIREINRKRKSLMTKLEKGNTSRGWVPTAMQDAVTKLLTALDFENEITGEQAFTADMLTQARDAYESINKGVGPEEARGPMASYYNGDLVETFDDLIKNAAGKTARQLTDHELAQIRDIVAGFSAAIINANEMFTAARNQTLSENGETQMQQNQERINKYGAHRQQGVLAQHMADAMKRGLLKPNTVMGEYEGTVMGEIWKALRNAENTHILNITQAEKRFREMIDKYHMQQTLNEEQTMGQRVRRDRARKNGKLFHLSDGQDVRLTTQELMTLYAWQKREQLMNTNHLQGGGFTIRNQQKGGSISEYRPNEADLRRFNEALTDEQKAFVDEMVSFLSNETSEWGNEVSEQLYGISKFTEKYYLPFTVNKNYVGQDPGQTQDARLKVASFTKNLTKNASTTLELAPFMQLWAGHVEQMSDFNAFTLPIEDMTRLMNYRQSIVDEEGNFVGYGKSMRPMMQQAWGKQSVDYIHSFLSRLNGNSRMEHGSGWLNTLMGSAKGAAVTFNLSVAMQQMGAGVRAMAEMNPIDVTKGIGKGLALWNINKQYAELEKYAPIATEKAWGYFDTNMKNGLYDRQRTNAWSRVEDLGGKMAEFGDKFNWVQIWQACKSEARRQNKGADNETILKKAGERFTQVIDRTQVVDSVFQRAEWATEKGMMKYILPFMSEPITMYNMLYRSATETYRALKSKEGRAKAIGKLVKTATAISLSGALTAFLKSLVTGLRDRDNDKKEKVWDEENQKWVEKTVGRRTYWDKVQESWGGNMLDNMLGVGTVFSSAIEDAIGSYRSSGSLTDAWIGNIVGAGKEILKGEDADWEKAWYKLAQGISSLSGVGFSSFYRDSKAIYMTVMEETGNMLIGADAYDESKTLDERLDIATQTFAYNKDFKGDGMKVSTSFYTDLLLETYMQDGMGEEFEKVADAAISVGATQAGLLTSFKTKLGAAEERIPQAAQALLDGDTETYNRIVHELVDAGIGTKTINSLINSAYNKLTDTGEEKDRGSGEGLIGKIQEDLEGASLLSTKAKELLTKDATVEDVQTAVTMYKQDGLSQEQIASKLTSAYKQDYIRACIDGNTAEQKRLQKILQIKEGGITKEKMAEWTGEGLFDSSSDTGIYYQILKGDADSAKKTAQWLYKNISGGQQAVKDRIIKWAKNRNSRGTATDWAKVRAVLKAMGFSQDTIDKCCGK